MSTKSISNTMSTGKKQYRECPNDSYWAGHIAAERETHQEKAQQFDAFRKGIADRLQVAFTSTSSDILYPEPSPACND
jgi:hypothetical protein